MGNCVRRESSMVWAEDEWDSVAPGQKTILYDAGNDHNHGEEEVNENMEERQRLLGGNSSESNREVKIKITKRELEELMSRVDMQGLTMEEVLAKLLTSCDNYSHHRSWKPALQSIPE